MENTETNFTPKQWVLVRDRKDRPWSLSIFSHKCSDEDGYIFKTVNNCEWKFCIPYEGNEHLLGTTDDYATPYVPKDGDFVYDETSICGFIYIFKSERDNDTNYCHALYCYLNGNIKLDDWCSKSEKIRKATEREKQRFLSELKEIGKKWNPDEMSIEAVWKPKDGDFVTYVYENGDTYVTIYKSQCETSYYVSLKIIGKTDELPHYNNELYSHYSECRPATEEERQQLVNKLHEHREDWDAEKKDFVFVPKEGDFIYCNNGDKFIGIHQYDSTCYHRTYVLLNVKTNRITYTDGMSVQDSCRLATEEEKQKLIDALHEKSKDWDAEKKDFVKWKWTPKPGQNYWAVCDDGTVTLVNSYDPDCKGDATRIKIGNCFKTEVDAQPYAEKFKNLFKR